MARQNRQGDRARLAGATTLVLAVSLALQGCVNVSRNPAPIMVPSGAVYSDVTSAFKHELTSTGRDQPDAVLEHVSKVEYSSQYSAYRVHMDVPAAELRQPRWGSFGSVDVTVCTWVTTYEIGKAGAKNIDVFGSDGVVAIRRVDGQEPGPC